METTAPTTFSVNSGPERTELLKVIAAAHGIENVQSGTGNFRAEPYLQYTWSGGRYDEATARNLDTRFVVACPLGDFPNDSKRHYWIESPR